MAPASAITRRRFFAALAGLGAAGVGGAAYMRWFESDWFEVSRRRIDFGRWPGVPPVRVLHLSDLHASGPVPLPMLRRAIELGLAERPDLILLTGDFWTDRYASGDDLAALLAALPAHAPTYAVVGNHDGGGWARLAGGYPTLEPAAHLLAAANIRWLHNAAEEVTVANRPVQLVGVGDFWAGDCEPEDAFRTLGATAGTGRPLRLVLNHNPDAKDLFGHLDWDLMLCGHTHGGQLRIPFTGGTPFAPVRDHRYVAGLNPWNDRQIFTTRGVGNLHGVRFNCRPEVSLLEVG